MNYPHIALNTMVVTDCFHTQTFPRILEKIKAAGIEAIEISQHIPFEAGDVLALKQPGMPEVCGFSVQIDGPVANPVPPMYFEDRIIPTYGAHQDFEKLVALCKEMNCPYLRFAGLPGAALTERETLDAYLTDLEKLARRYADQGLGLCLHNHTEEFIRVEGRWLLEWMLEKVPHLQFELDLLNAQKAGVSPVRLLEKCKGRVPLVHLQDMGVFPSPDGEWMKPEYRNQGNMPLADLWRAACHAGVKYLVIEQWPLYGKDPYGEINTSVKALKEVSKS